MTQAHLDLLADVVRRRSGLLLPPGKHDLVQSKLKPVAARFGFKRVCAMVAELEDEPEELARAVTEAMTVNETSFFRDPAVFEHLRVAALPALLAARSEARRLRIWCAAASTGQEPYSLAMLLDGMELAAADWKLDLFATDLRGEAVQRMADGCYSGFELARGLPLDLRARYFAQEDGQWRVAQRLRRMLRPARFNLLDSYGWLGRLDLILCRNALFYFAPEERIDALVRMERALAPGGLLVMGPTESPADAAPSLVPAGPRGIFAKAGTAAGWPARRAG